MRNDARVFVAMDSPALTPQDDLPIFSKKWNLATREEQEKNWAEAAITEDSETLEIMGVQVMVST